ncbi:ROK family transcriptional regulator [Leifsonia sp. H3M29-4]|uniref:ROK family transcriptional regulator n=1 Tax=Salinibacterium metalliresistens TaxID=3031321 RepID=UPI0023DCAD64|nr:ROK family transcriptional regulator [Salinibacterium metalliresistens]MDF1478532.1 ROK family transcriptional regulator [Salinibacterium metalliresistens]
MDTGDSSNLRIATPPWITDPGAHRAVALEVLLHGPLSRSEIARRLDLSPGSLTRLSAPLIESGLLVEVGERGDGKAGRPSRPLDVVPASRHFIGMKLMGDQVLGAVTDLRAEVLGSLSATLTSQEPDAVVEVIGQMAERLAALVPSVTALGIGVGGLLDEHGTVISAPFLGWEGVPLAALVEARSSIPTVVANDLVAFTEYEHWFGAARGLERFAVITLGAGIGYGLVANGRIVANEDSGIGLVGHWPIDPYGPVCPAGHRGCARSIMTQAAIVTAVSTALDRPVTYDEALSLAADGEAAARRVVDDAGRGLGKLLAAVANLTVPQMIVLGGEGVGLVDVARDAVRAGMAEDRDPRAHEIPLVTTTGDNTEWCRGAAVIAIQTYVLGS